MAQYLIDNPLGGWGCAPNYEAMREMVSDYARQVWDQEGQPLDPAWPRAAAEEHNWEIVDEQTRVICLPNGMQIEVWRCPDPTLIDRIRNWVWAKRNRIK